AISKVRYIGFQNITQQMAAYKITLQVVIHVHRTLESCRSSTASHALYVVSCSPTMQELHKPML
ncbi:Hypothetical predicted protein, partial [Olea europaea subsp. europaea]